MNGSGDQGWLPVVAWFVAAPLSSPGIHPASVDLPREQK